MEELDNYVCAHCGNSTPIPSDHCAVCGSPMKLDEGRRERQRELDDDHETMTDLDGASEENLNSDGTLSLEEERQREEEADSDDSYGDDANN